MSADRMNPLDATFLHVEDRVSHMHIGSIGILEGPPPAHEDLTSMVSGKLHLIPRYRQVVRTVPFQLGRPVWVDDPDFDIGYHVRRTALPEEGGDDQLRNLVGRVMAQQLDRTKPLWEIWVVENLADDQWAMISKVHHCMVDGVSGAELLSVVLDIFPDPPPVDPVTWVPKSAPSGIELAAEAVVDLIRSPYEQVRAVRASLRGPQRVAHAALEVAKGVASVAVAAVPEPTSSLNGPIGPNRRYDWAVSSVADVKAVRHGLGGTFNDVVLAAIAGGFRAMLIERSESIDRVVRSLVPVSVRPRDESGKAVGDGKQDNQVAAMFADLPVGIDDPVERLHAVSAMMADLKESHQAVAAEALVSASGFAPPMLLALGLRVAAKAPQRSINTVTTNVPGPQLPLYVLGRPLKRAFPYVPLAGHLRTGVAIFSYNGEVTFGVTGDYDTTSDLRVLVEGIDKSMAEMLAAAGAPHVPVEQVGVGDDSRTESRGGRRNGSTDEADPPGLATVPPRPRRTKRSGPSKSGRGPVRADLTDAAARPKRRRPSA